MSKNKEKHHSREDADTGRQIPQDAGQPAREDAHSGASGRKTGDESRTAGTGRQTTDDERQTAEAGQQPANQVEKLAQLNDRLLRLQADFDNFRKRTLREKNDLFDSANQSLMLELLPVLDHLHLGIQATAEHQVNAAFREGLVMILDQLMGALSKFGLSPIATEKQVFDPSRFEAVNALPSATEPEGTVTSLVRRGYMLRNKLLRPAQVIVSSGPPPEKKADDRRQTTDDGQEKTKDGSQETAGGKD
ncbi:MAG: nucleotide exchange factor GrpE [Kiritimatiellae bacterium]|nr:nucleotide exchange factor GrpE [Kiritimatiellia bacterium]